MKKDNRENIFTYKKSKCEKITMLTAYSYPFAKIADESGVDCVLVGDSLANVELGLDCTTQIGMNEIIYHTKAVKKAIERAHILVDMPYASFHSNANDTLLNAKKLLSVGADSVKVEWHDTIEENISLFKANNIPFVGHVGLTPQTAAATGGFKVRGKTDASAARILEQAKLFENMGAMAIVVECVPESLGREITAQSEVAVIGIGAGKYCDGQVLVSYDVLGLFDKYTPKFVKKYANLKNEVLDAFAEYVKDVKDGNFPSGEHTFKN